MIKHIKDNIRKVGQDGRQPWKTDNPNIVKFLRTEEEDVHLDKLEINIRHLASEIAKASPIPYPVDATDTMKKRIDEVNAVEGVSVERLKKQKNDFIKIWEQVTEKTWL